MTPYREVPERAPAPKRPITVDYRVAVAFAMLMWISGAIGGFIIGARHVPCECTSLRELADILEGTIETQRRTIDTQRQSLDLLEARIKLEGAR